MKNCITLLGRGVISGVGHTGGLAILFGQTLKFTFFARWKRDRLTTQMLSIGVGSLPVIIMTGAFIGMVLALQSYYQLHKLNVETVIGALVGLSMARELGPVMAGIMLTARVGAAMAAELGTMKVTEQVDALQALATNPVHYLVVPRFLACVFLTPILTIYTIFVGIVGGYLISVNMMGIDSAFYLGHTVDLVGPVDIFTGLIKAVFFGAIVAGVCCYRGLNAGGGAEGVGRATTGAVVISSVLILAADLFLTLIFNILSL